MNTNSLIRIEEVCANCNIDITFIQSLHELGHIELIIQSNDYFISDEQLKSLESLIYFHTELQINLEGIDTIAHLLKRIEVLQAELLESRNRLK